MTPRIRHLHHTVLIMVISTLVLAGLVAASPPGAAGKADKASVGSLRWAKSVVAVLDYTPQAVAPHVEAMAAQWSMITGGAVTLAYARRDARSCDDVAQQAGAIVVCAAPAQVTPIGETILVRKKAAINSAKIWYYGDGTESYLDWCLLHELGHALGLGHQSDGITSVMYPYALAVTTPLPLDVTMVQALYGSAGSIREQRAPKKAHHRQHDPKHRSKHHAHR